MISLRRAAAVALAYFVAGKLAVLLAIPPGYATAVWPAAGVALVAVATWGRAALPGIALGSLLVNAGNVSSTEGVMRSLAVALVIGAGAALQAWIAVALIRRRTPLPGPLEEPREILTVVVLGGPVACLVNATIGVSTLAIAGVLAWRELPFSWLTWWVGDTVGSVLLAPPLLLHVVEPRPARRRRLAVTGPLLIGFAVLTALYVMISGWERQRQRDAFHNRAAPMVSALQARLRTYENVDVLRLARMIETTRRDLGLDDVAITLLDVSGPRPAVLHGRAGLGAPWVRAEVEVGGRHWQLALRPSPTAAEQARSWAAWTVLATGLVVVGLLGVLTLVLTGRAAQAERDVATTSEANVTLERLVAERTRHLDAAVREREVLLKEIHHRVKNNLQVISSLLGLQAHHVTDADVRALLEESRRRVHAISLVHEHLYQTRDLARVDGGPYLRSLIDNLNATFGAARRSITIVLSAAGVHLSPSAAIPCGLIVSELVTNSFKHAFPADRAGRITVTLLALDHGRLSLAVGDDGVGLPPGFDPRRSPTLGLDLCFSFADQLAAEVTLAGPPGFTFTLTFAPEEPA